MHDHDDGSHGLDRDLRFLLARSVNRRNALRMIASASAIPLVGCVSASSGLVDAGGLGRDGGIGSDGSTNGTDAGTETACTVIPEETAGPYPGDGTNGANALGLSGIVRSDIRASIAGATGVAAGVPLTISLRVLQTAASCAPLAGYAVYLWHCDRDGSYSMYSAAAAGENYLRGVQETDDQGRVTFTSIFPACYAGRWPHIHFEIYPSLASATNGANKIATSQLALPEASCNEVFATAGYEASVRNLATMSLASDNVFSDGASTQTPTISGDPSSGYAVALTVGTRG
jgi:protocatechuate 3,4-dioxygenase beta subunit